MLRRGVRALVFAIVRGPIGRSLVLIAACAGLIKLVLAFGPFALVFAMFSVVSTTLMLASMTLVLSIAASWRSQGRFARSQMLEDGVCPGCVYPLEALEPEPDGMIVCPECGGAWDPDPGSVRRIVIPDPAAA